MMFRLLPTLALLVALAGAGCGRRDAGHDAGHGSDHHEVAAADHPDAESPAAGHPEGAGHHDDDEGVVQLAPDVLRAAGIRFAAAAPDTLDETLTFTGEIALNADRLAHIVPRFPGVVREVRGQLGARVRAGDVLAVIESNESLTTYEVRSLIAGTLVEKHITLGEFVTDTSDIFVVADLATVWLNLAVPPRDLARLRVGQAVHVQAPQAEARGQARVSYIGPLVAESTRSVSVRATLENAAGAWRPGLFATGDVHVGRVAAAVTVPQAAVQRVAGRDVVFVRHPEGARLRPVELGRADSARVEILAGLSPGDSVAVTEAFLLKAELGKSEAGHDH